VGEEPGAVAAVAGIDVPLLVGAIGVVAVVVVLYLKIILLNLLPTAPPTPIKFTYTWQLHGILPHQGEICTEDGSVEMAADLAASL